jgi:PAS domain S-box-containing protein
MTRDISPITPILNEGKIAEMINDASIDRIIAFDIETKIISWNDSCATLTGIAREIAIGKSFFDVFENTVNNKEVNKAIEGALQGYRMFIPSEKCAEMGSCQEVHFIPLKDKDGNIAGVLCLMHDVAHRVKTENELKSLNKSLARKNKELKEKNAEILSFEHVTGHDLKDPLRKIYAFIEMIWTRDGQNLSDASKGYFKRAQAAVQRMGMLTDDLMNFSLIGMNSKEEKQVLNLNHILKVAKNKLADVIKEKNAVIESEQLPVISGFRSMLIELFQHLLANSIKFQKDKEPHIQIAFCTLKGTEITSNDAVADTTCVRISFKDNGIGFDQKYADKMFQMFQRLNGKDAYPGSGMGLTLCRKIMSLHNGFIVAESLGIEGSVFHCYFPQ